MAKMKSVQPEKLAKDYYPTPDIPGIKPDPKLEPIMKALGVCFKDGLWSCFEVSFRVSDRCITSIDYTPADMRMLAQEQYKLKSIKLMDELMKDF